MSNIIRAIFVFWSAVTVLLSAFLLFQVQPIISKIILPWFGGSPAVWTSCMLFFQILLLGGYAYAHFLATSRHPGWALGVHLGLLLLATLTLPILPGEEWKPADSSQPTWRILTLLAYNIGVPYLALASTGPLIQAWYSRVLEGNSPYRLYSLSNVGSLGALLSYPFLFEPLMTTTVQAISWSVVFCVFAMLCCGLAIASHVLGQRIHPPESSPKSSLTPVINEQEAAFEHKLAWFALPALASVMLLAITHHVCQDVAVIPFFWVVPLSLYLLSFIICFDRAIWYRRRLFSMLTAAALFGLCLVMLDGPIEKQLAKLKIDIDISDTFRAFTVESTVYLAVLFLICMVCHGELVRLKPSPRKLTSFYLMVSAGGAFGGVFVALVCPQIFTFISNWAPLPVRFEMNLGLVFAFMLSVGVLWDDLWNSRMLAAFWKKAVMLVVCFGFLLVVVRAQFEDVDTDSIVIRRNFYGTLSVEEFFVDSPDIHLRELVNGRILHGAQYMSREKRDLPTTYYNILSGIGVALMNYRSNDPLRVGVVGLGTGTIASYGREGDYYCFYEINPTVLDLAMEQFYFLEDTAAEVKVELGDARISMERQEDQEYDIIALDAFSGDAIPVHLLTTEAFKEYLRHLKPQGIIAVHISNRHLDLSPIVGGLGKEFNIPVVTVDYTEDDDDLAGASSEWVLLTRNYIFLGDPAVSGYVTQLDFKPLPIWTDQYSNLLHILE